MPIYLFSMNICPLIKWCNIALSASAPTYHIGQIVGVKDRDEIQYTT